MNTGATKESSVPVAKVSGARRSTRLRSLPAAAQGSSQRRSRSGSIESTSSKRKRETVDNACEPPVRRSERVRVKIDTAIAVAASASSTKIATKTMTQPLSSMKSSGKSFHRGKTVTPSPRMLQVVTAAKKKKNIVPSGAHSNAFKGRHKTPSKFSSSVDSGSSFSTRISDKENVAPVVDTLPPGVYDLYAPAVMGQEKPQWEYIMHPSFEIGLDIDGTRYESNLVYWQTYGRDYYKSLFDWEKECHRGDMGDDYDHSAHEDTMAHHPLMEHAEHRNDVSNEHQVSGATHSRGDSTQRDAATALSMMRQHRILHEQGRESSGGILTRSQSRAISSRVLEGELEMELRDDIAAVAPGLSWTQNRRAERSLSSLSCSSSPASSISSCSHSDSSTQLCSGHGQQSTSQSDDDAQNGEIYPRHPELTPRMRMILVDWLVDVAEECKLQGHTLHSAVALLDRVLNLPLVATKNSENEANEVTQIWSIPRDMLQCVGCACMLIASKMEELRPPHVDDFVYLSDNSYTKRQILDVELQICVSLRFDLKTVTSHHFLERFARAGCVRYNHSSSVQVSVAASPLCDVSHPNSKCHKRIKRDDGNAPQSILTPVVTENRRNMQLLLMMMRYLLELGLTDDKVSSRAGSEVAAAATYLAKLTLGMVDLRQVNDQEVNDRLSQYKSQCADEVWNDTMTYYTGYDLNSLEDAIKELYELQLGAEKADHNKVFDKYKRKNYMCVALRTVPCKEGIDFL